MSLSHLILSLFCLLSLHAVIADPPAAAPASAIPTPSTPAATVDLSSVHSKLDTLSASVQSLNELRSSISSLSTTQSNVHDAVQTLTQQHQALKQAVASQHSQQATPAAPVDVSQLTNKFTESQSTLSVLSSSIEKTLTQLTTAQGIIEKQQAAVAELREKAETRWNTISNELVEIKKLLQAAAAKKDDKGSDATALKNIQETQQAILHKLEHSTLTNQAWTVYDQTRVHVGYYAHEFWALTERGLVRVQEYTPILTEKANDIYQHLSTDGLKHAQTAYGHSEQFVLDSHGRLTNVLATQGVPHEHAPLASITILSILGFIVLLIVLKIVIAFLRCITCRSGKKVVKKGPTPAPSATPAKKK